MSTLSLSEGEVRWKPARRWWGRGLDGQQMEIDLVAEGLDGQFLLLGEVKWRERQDQGLVFERLRYFAENFPRSRGRKVILGVWLKRGGGADPRPGEFVVDPEGTLPVLR